ncbi:Alpha-1,6-mannosyltransferase involved in cell wall mannan biosynthesis [Komagataella phaffii GS115]|uniref:Alpha-1,6-mannosyltransferase involved in cell wall mannan biosynthesis n=1 Tax=Komagataella phaffii (strain GS115 / ATCC 20864) TaxID=644223 RepID=C4R531_KOMPG|nr:Alpha-1,6-mannosyltransferase involved in cell wall mannan biosynthesis [Komagataella phaffii GS115]CAY70667.1 Alpha-1,6-mannosyltransferase involved in cell wall mannan biosynthesis [Komagataella phaffii GS115]
MQQQLFRKVIWLTVGLITVILVIIKISSSKSTATDLQKVLKNANILPQDVINYNSRKVTDELASKLDEIQKKYLSKQDDRISKLEAERADLLEQVRFLRNPPAGSSLREKLAYLFPYNENGKFPAYIWQTWKYGLNDDRFGEKFKEGETQWASKNPGFVHELFNDDTSGVFIHHLYINVPEVIKAYELLPNIILKMDFFRYLVLYAKGGVYADVDTMPLQPVPNWIPENVSPKSIGMIIGIQNDANNPDWKKITELIAKITEDTLQRAESNSLELADISEEGGLSDKNLSIMQWTGTGIFTDAIFTYFNDYIQSSIYTKVTWKEFSKLRKPKLVSDVLVLPIISFSAGAGSGKSTELNDPLAFVQHYFERLHNDNH